MSVFVRSGEPFNYDTREAGRETAIECRGPGAKQSFKDEVDINTIVKRFGLTGQLPSDVRVPQYADFVEVTDYHTAMIQVRAAQEAFMEMPANVRARFHHDAGELVAFVSDEKNRDEAIKLGLVVPKVVPAEPGPVKVEIVSMGEGGSGGPPPKKAA